ncbi:MAG TPA: D-2-hydroxyacid dehydrogenase [Candidatus Polarisedimenticolia bacterium]|nr:D-2-hydroxyacid dehydrogenase [Candidatus Polarisedimenticolia bacterium]
MSKKVLIFLVSPHKIWDLDPKYPKLLSERFPELDVVAARDKEESLRHLPEAEILYGWSLPEKHFPLARCLKWIHIPSAGVEDSLYRALVESRIRITCSRGISSAALADHAFGMVLAFSRGLAVAIRDGSTKWIRTHFFDADPMPVELDGKTLGILGFGSIGRELARRGRAFGMRVHALKRHRVEEEPLADRVFSPREMEAFLASADYLAVTLPLTSETRGILDEKRLAAMKPTAVLVNIARGGLVREAALIEALQSGRLAGAGLDVFEQEPLPADSPLYRMPNVVLTPHIGGLHPNYLDRATSLFIVNLGRYLKGETLLHEVDKKAGY